jgi:hypothetical protein
MHRYAQGQTLWNIKTSECGVVEQFFTRGAQIWYRITDSDGLQGEWPESDVCLQEEMNP